MTNSLEFMGLVVTPDGTLYGASAADGNLYSIDLSTGVPTMVGPLGAGGMMGGTGGMMGGMGGIMGLAMHPNGDLYGLDATGTLFQINPKTGQATLVLIAAPPVSHPFGV
jgi:streptogramin lyase